MKERSADHNMLDSITVHEPEIKLALWSIKYSIQWIKIYHWISMNAIKKIQVVVLINNIND